MSGYSVSLCRLKISVGAAWSCRTRSLGDIVKTLYSILGLAPDASSAQIETAYAELLASLGQQGTGQDDHIRLIAIKEAYSILSDPIKRQVYNQKLFAPETISRRATANSTMEPDAAEAARSGRGHAAACAGQGRVAAP